MERRDGGGVKGRRQQKRQIYVKSLGVKVISGGRSSSAQLAGGCSREAPEGLTYSVGNTGSEDAECASECGMCLGFMVGGEGEE